MCESTSPFVSFNHYYNLKIIHMSRLELSFSKKLIIGFVAVMLAGFASFAPLTSQAQNATSGNDSLIAQLQQQINDLMQQLIALQNAQNRPPEGFKNGDSVITTTNLHVRNNPGPNGVVIGTVPAGTVGEVVGGPSSAGDYQWYRIVYSTGLTGWSAAPWLVANGIGDIPVEPRDAHITDISTDGLSVAVTVRFGEDAVDLVNGSPIPDFSDTCGSTPTEYTIDWGDGSSPETLLQFGCRATNDTVTGYMYRQAGTYTLTIRNSAGQVTSSDKVRVSDVNIINADLTAEFVRWTINTISNSVVSLDYEFKLTATGDVWVSQDSQTAIEANFELPAGVNVSHSPFVIEGVSVNSHGNYRMQKGTQRTAKFQTVFFGLDKANPNDVIKSHLQKLRFGFKPDDSSSTKFVFSYDQYSVGSYKVEIPVYAWGRMPECSLTASQTTINRGESTTLTWRTENAGLVTLFRPNIGTTNEVRPNGRTTVTPGRTGTFLIRAGNALGSKECPLQITVEHPMASSTIRSISSDVDPVIQGLAPLGSRVNFVIDEVVLSMTGATALNRVFASRDITTNQNGTWRQVVRNENLFKEGQTYQVSLFVNGESMDAKRFTYETQINPEELMSASATQTVSGQMFTDLQIALVGLQQYLAR